jgi:AcrR family transcriptional regulator
MRADAERNRGRLLDAACRTYMEQGPEAPLDAIARRAGLGIATLYRHFGDRTALLRAVAADVLAAAEAAGDRARAEEPDAFSALRRYMHDVLDGCVPVLMPALGPAVREAPEVRARLDAAAAVQRRLIDDAKAEGTLHPDVEFADIGLALTRFARPIAGDFDPAAEAALAHRHLELFVRGLRSGDGAPLPGPALTLGGLRSMRSP